MAKYLVLGDGLLGSEIVKQTDWKYISRKKDGFNANFYSSWDCLIEYMENNDCDGIVNCIGYTNTYDESLLGVKKHWDTNYKFVIDLVDFCNEWDVKLIHISTDYVYGGSVHEAKETDVPVPARNWYTYSKLLADGYILGVYDDMSLVIRTSFKPKPFPYKYAIMTQMGNFDYVDVISNLIVKLIEKKAKGVFNVGTEKKTIFNLAKKTVPNIMPSNEILHPSMPIDITMNIEKMKKIIKGAFK